MKILGEHNHSFHEAHSPYNNAQGQILIRLLKYAKCLCHNATRCREDIKKIYTDYKEMFKELVQARTHRRKGYIEYQYSG
jgi:hypothetical protein